MVPGRSKVAGEVVGPPGCNRSAELWESGGGGREVVPGRPEVRAEVSPLQLGRSATTPRPTPLPPSPTPAPPPPYPDRSR